MLDDKLKAALDAVIQEGTFSLSAVEGVKRLRDENEMLVGKVGALEERIKSMTSYNKDLEVKCSEYNEEKEALTSREAAVTKREIEITKLECGVIQERAVAAAYKDCFGLVFRNQHVHRNISSYVPAPVNSNGFSPQMVSTNSSETESVS